MAKVTKKEIMAALWKRVAARTAWDVQRRLIKRMSRIHVSPRTHVSDSHIGRNDPCYCGKTKKVGVRKVDPTNGAFIFVEEDTPVKFKHCCLHKHLAQQQRGSTAETANFIKKQDVYFAKKMGRTKDASV